MSDFEISEYEKRMLGAIDNLTNNLIPSSSSTTKICATNLSIYNSI